MRFLKNCLKIAENGGFLEQNELGSFMKRDRTTHNIQIRKKIIYVARKIINMARKLIHVSSKLFYVARKLSFSQLSSELIPVKEVVAVTRLVLI